MKTQTKQIQVFQLTSAPDYSLRTKTENDVKYLIVPVVMMVEGVHNGSRGPILHTALELGESVKLWKDIPVTIDHPQASDGSFVSVNSGDHLNRAVGMIRNAKMDGSKLKAEAWLNEQKLIAQSPTAHQHIVDKLPLDVSVGVFSGELDVTGIWNDEEYKGIAVNHVPDHLALLPDQKGACSWDDGCGIRVNKDINQNQQAMENLITVLKELNAEGFAFEINKVGYSETYNQVQAKLNSMDNEQRYHFLEEIYDDHIIYQVRSRDRNDTKMYKQDYTTLENSDIELTGNPVEVRRQVDYIALSEQGIRGKNVDNNSININHKNDENMDEKLSPCLKAKVDGLINNKFTRFDESHREFLSAQSEEILKAFEPIEQEKPKPADPPQVNREEALAVLQLNTVEDFVALMKDDVKQVVESGLAHRDRFRKEMIQTIQANSEKDTWLDSELDAMTCETLEKISKSVKRIVDYSGAGAGNGENSNNQEADDEKLLPPDVK